MNRLTSEHKYQEKNLAENRDIAVPPADTTLCQMFYRGRPVNIEIPTKLICARCERPSLDTFTCPCKTCILCRRCMVNHFISGNILINNEENCQCLNNNDLLKRGEQILDNLSKNPDQKIYLSEIRGSKKLPEFFAILPCKRYQKSTKSIITCYKNAIQENLTESNPDNLNTHFSYNVVEAMTTLGLVDVGFDRIRPSTWKYDPEQGTTTINNQETNYTNINFDNIKSHENVTAKLYEPYEQSSDVISGLLEKHGINREIPSIYFLTTEGTFHGQLVLTMPISLNLPNGIIGGYIRRLVTRFYPEVKCFTIDFGKQPLTIEQNSFNLQTPLKRPPLDYPYQDHLSYVSVKLSQSDNPLCIILTEEYPDGCHRSKMDIWGDCEELPLGIEKQLRKPKVETIKPDGSIPHSRKRNSSSPEGGFGIKKASLAASGAPSTSKANRAKPDSVDVPPEALWPQ